MSVTIWEQVSGDGMYSGQGVTSTAHLEILPAYGILLADSLLVDSLSC